jgi:hypothetical protein
MIQVDYTITWGGDPEDVYLAAIGRGGLHDVDAMWREAIADPRWVDGMKIIADHTQADWSDLTASEMEARAAQIKQMAADLGRQQVALIARNESDQAVAKMVALLLDMEVDFVAHAFPSLPAAREWLRQTPTSWPAHIRPRP